MSNYINIGGVDDVHYRYKMPKPEMKWEGKGNGVRTLVMNMFDVAKALKVPPTYPTAYYGFDLGAQYKYDSENGRAVINGTWAEDVFMKSLNDFIKKLVLCPNCKLPETQIEIEKGEKIFLKCGACGAHKEADISGKAMGRMSQFIVKNPPQKESTIVSLEKKQSQATEVILVDDKDENIEWSTDVSEEAVKKRREEEGLSERIKTLTIALDEDEEVIISPIDLLKEYVKSRQNATEQQLLKACLKLKKDYDMKDSEVAFMLFEACFDDKNLLTNLKKRGKVLHRFMKTTVCQKTILGYLEELLGKDAELLEKTSIVLEYFYLNEMIDEEVFVKWFAEKKSKFVKDPAIVEKVKAGARPFMTWLTTAEAEGETQE
jgi:translation initiation factor 5